MLHLFFVPGTFHLEVNKSKGVTFSLSPVERPPEFHLSSPSLTLYLVLGPLVASGPGMQ